MKHPLVGRPFPLPSTGHWVGLPKVIKSHSRKGRNNTRTPAECQVRGTSLGKASLASVLIELEHSRGALVQKSLSVEGWTLSEGGWGLVGPVPSQNPEGSHCRSETACWAAAPCPASGPLAPGLSQGAASCLVSPCSWTSRPGRAARVQRECERPV